MKTKMTTIPFEVELAKRIQAGKYPGKIVTREGKDIRIICWDAKGKRPIIALISTRNFDEISFSLTGKGTQYSDNTQGMLDLFLEVPKWTQYKSGDFLATDKGALFVLKDIVSGRAYYHFALTCDLTISFDDNTPWCGVNSIRGYVVDSEKQLFIDSLKRSTDPRVKDILKRYFSIEEGEGKPECEFKPFDKVLVRDSDDEIWMTNFFSHYDNDHAYKHIICGNSSFRICIPYNEKTKHLVGTTDDWEEE